jgi:hypothetical protein
MLGATTRSCYLIALLEEVTSLKTCILLKYNNKILSHDLQHKETWSQYKYIKVITIG